MKNRLLLISLAVILILSIGLIGCGGEGTPETIEYDLTISSTEGGLVTTPGEGTFTYDEGEKINLAAIPDEGYQFVSWTGDVTEIADVEDATTTITMKDDYSITANFAVKQYNLITSSTEGGSVITPGEDAYTYNKGEVINLVAVAEEGYVFMNWTGDVSTIADVSAASTTITMNGGYSITANFAKGIWDWYDLDAIRNNLDGSYILMNDLDSTSAGYGELAGPTANGGKGWQPIRNPHPGSAHWTAVMSSNPFAGSFDGQGYEIRDLFIHRPDEACVGLVGWLDSGGIIRNIAVVNINVTGGWDVAGLVGRIGYGIVRNSYSTGSVTGVHESVGGLVGIMDYGYGTVSNSYSTTSVTGHGAVGGLVGANEQGTIIDSYSAGSVTGETKVGGLVGFHGWATIRNSYYNHDEVPINGEHVITVGALFNEDFEQWLANDKSLDVNQRLSQEDGYYVIERVSDLKELLVFGQDDLLKFRLTSDLDLANEPNFHVPYLAGEFDGNGHKIMNLSFGYSFVEPLGLFGYLDFGGEIGELRVEDVNITGHERVGGLVGESGGTVGKCYSTGSVTGIAWIGGLVGWNNGILGDSSFAGSLTGQCGVGGLAGKNTGSVINSYYNCDEVLINTRNVITTGALFSEDFEQWLANDKSLDVNEKLSQEDGYYLINDVSDFKQLLAFGQDSSLRFRLTDDLSLAAEPNFYIPYLAGEFDGSGHSISNLSLHLDFASDVGLFGVLDHSGEITQIGLANVDIASSGSYVGALVGDNRGGMVTNCYAEGSITAGGCVGGLLGFSTGTISDCLFVGDVTGDWCVGGLVGTNEGTLAKCYSMGSVTGNEIAGGLVGENRDSVSDTFSTSSVKGQYGVGGLSGTNTGTVSKCYSTGSVTGQELAGGLIGFQYRGTAPSSFWDVQTSGTEEGNGGTGKTTAEMRNIATFSGAGWNIVAVASSSTRNPAYIWNIVDGQTYPFLSWESIS